MAPGCTGRQTYAALDFEAWKLCKSEPTTCKFQTMYIYSCTGNSLLSPRVHLSCELQNFCESESWAAKGYWEINLSDLRNGTQVALFQLSSDQTSPTKHPCWIQRHSIYQMYSSTFDTNKNAQLPLELWIFRSWGWPTCRRQNAAMPKPPKTNETKKNLKSCSIAWTATFCPSGRSKIFAKSVGRSWQFQQSNR